MNKATEKVWNWMKEYDWGDSEGDSYWELFVDDFKEPHTDNLRYNADRLEDSVQASICIQTAREMGFTDSVWDSARWDELVPLVIEKSRG